MLQFAGYCEEFLSYIPQFFAIIILLGVAFLAYWHRDKLLLVLAGFAFIAYGLSFWIGTVYMYLIMVLFGMYFIYKAFNDKRTAG